jgi:hypothetical protein
MKHPAVLALIASLLSITSLTSCGGDATAIAGPTPAAVAGTWTLRTVNGIVVPATIPMNGTPITFLNIRLILDASGSFSALDSTIAGHDTLATPTRGAFTLASDSIYFAADGNDVGSAGELANNNTITVRVTGPDLVYVVGKE